MLVSLSYSTTFGLGVWAWVTFLALLVFVAAAILLYTVVRASRPSGSAQRGARCGFNEVETAVKGGNQTNTVRARAESRNDAVTQVAALDEVVTGVRLVEVVDVGGTGER